MPAEWEPHDAVWLGWEEDSIRRYYPGIVSLIKSISTVILSATGNFCINFESPELKMPDKPLIYAADKR